MTNARPFWTSTLQDLSNDTKNTPMQGVFGLCCRTLNIRESRRTPNPQLWVWEFHPPTSPKVRLRHQSSIGYGAYQNLLWLNIYQETTITTMFNAVAQGEGIMFFLDGPGGSGKTFIYSVLLASVRRDKHIVIGVTSSSIAALLLEGGQTSHSVFKIPITLGKDSNVLNTCVERFC
jgi:hypothetical protein